LQRLTVIASPSLEVEGLKRPMPLFQCPKCGKRYVLSFPMPVSLLESTPIGQQEFGIDCVYVSTCPDCSAGKFEVADGDRLEEDVDVIVNA
jgi:Zn finger protein HypA/HybF involved in hydrogenase expression